MLATFAAAVVLQVGPATIRPEQLTGEVKVPSPAARAAPAKPPPAPPRTVNGRPLKTGLGPADFAYQLADGVRRKEVVYFSDGVACFGVVFYPKGFDPNRKPGVPAVVLGQGYAGNHISIEKYAAKMAEHGLVAMAIDYRGWGYSEGFATLVNQRVGGGMARDETRFETKTVPVRVKRTKLIPQLQQEDYRNAISYIQGEPGVDPARIGVWGSSLAGGNAVAVAGQDARVKAVSVQIPSIGGPPEPRPTPLRGAALADAIKRAREGLGQESMSGFSRQFATDQYEQAWKMAENYTMFWAARIGVRPFQVIVAANEELINNERSGKAAYNLAKGPKNYIEVPDMTHFEMYSGRGFEISGPAAAQWFAKHLNAPEAADPPAPARP